VVALAGTVNATAAMVAAPATEARRVRFLMGDLPSGCFH
jgi:hypothetical protein